MKKEIYKVTSKKVLKMIENVDYLDCRKYIIDLSNQLKVEKFDDLLLSNGEYCIFTYDKNLVEAYKLIIKTKKGA